MARKKAIGFPAFEDVQTQLEAEVRRVLTPRTSAAPSGSRMAPHLSPALIEDILREMPELYAAFRRVIEAAYRGG